MKENSLLKNSIYKAILTIVDIAIPVFIGPYIARVLDVGLYGEYNKIYSEMQVFLVFAGFGIYNFGVREISKIRNDKEKVSKLFSNLFVFSLISNILCTILFLLYGFVFSSGISHFLYALISLQLVANIFYVEFVNEALENYSFITIKGVIVKIFYFLFLILFVKKPEDILIYALVVGLTVLINYLLSFIYIKRRIKFNFKKIELKKYIKPLIYVLIINNVSLLYAQLDKIMLGQFVDGVSVTIYYIAYYIVITITSIPAAMVYVAIPRISYLFENKDKEECNLLINKILSTFLLFVIPMIIGMFALANEIITIYGSDKYLAAVLPFLIICSFRIITCVGFCFVQLVFYPSGQEKKYIKYSLICGTLNVLLNTLLVVFDVFNPATAMLTTGICETILFVLEVIYIKKKMQIDVQLLNKKHIKYFITSLLFIPISLLIKRLNLGFAYTSLLVIGICGILYFLVLFISKDENYNYIVSKMPIGKLKNILIRKDKNYE